MNNKQLIIWLGIVLLIALTKFTYDTYIKPEIDMKSIKEIEANLEKVIQLSKEITNNDTISESFSAKSKTIELFNEAIKTVSPSVIEYRLREIIQLQPSSQNVKLKTTYIQASNDKLVPSKSLKDWQKVCDNIDVFKVKGEHFILQANSIRCAEVVTEAVRLITSTRSQY